jgi:hypothetical protein
MKNATTQQGIYPMTKNDAVRALKPFSGKMIRKVWENEKFPSQALSVLHSGFEYPDWDYRTVGEFLRKFA